MGLVSRQRKRQIEIQGNSEYPKKAEEKIQKKLGDFNNENKTNKTNTKKLNS